MSRRTLSRTEKADAYDRLITEISYREPSVNLAIQQRGGSSGWARTDEVTRFLGAFDALTDHYKRHKLGDDRCSLDRAAKKS